MPVFFQAQKYSRPHYRVSWPARWAARRSWEQFYLPHTDCPGSPADARRSATLFHHHRYHAEDIEQDIYFFANIREVYIPLYAAAPRLLRKNTRPNLFFHAVCPHAGNHNPREHVFL